MSFARYLENLHVRVFPKVLSLMTCVCSYNQFRKTIKCTRTWRCARQGLALMHKGAGVQTVYLVIKLFSCFLSYHPFLFLLILSPLPSLRFEGKECRSQMERDGETGLESFEPAFGSERNFGAGHKIAVRCQCLLFGRRYSLTVVYNPCPALAKKSCQSFLLFWGK